MLGKREMDEIKILLRHSIDNNFIAGANLMVVKDRKEILYYEDGFADIEKRIPIKRNSIFRLYSMTKPITAAAVMILLQRGEIDLYDPVSKYISGFRNPMVEEKGRLIPACREVTLKDLLSMTSGLVYDGENTAGKETSSIFEEMGRRLLSDLPMSTIEFANKIGKCPLAFNPGTSWHYGVSADILGAIIEVVSGKSFRNFLKEELFQPLNMNDTDFWVPEEKLGRLVSAYSETEKGKIIPYTGNNLDIINKMDRKPAFESGGAGLASTIDDYAKFANMLMNNGSLAGREILYPKTVKYLTSATLNAEQQSGLELWETLCGYSYGNLMRVMVHSSKAGDLASNGEYGWDGWLGTYFCNSPKDNLTFLFMIQKKDAGTTSLTRKLRNIILSSCCN